MSFVKNRRMFDSMCAQAVAAQGHEARMALARKAITFAVNHPTGYYSSDAMEGIFLEVARSLNPLAPKKMKEGTVLHVMTECYFDGGHTRVVERWMELDSIHEHSLLFTANEKQKIPPRLNSAVTNSGGTIITLPDSDTDMEKGATLRALASGYEFVVLHIHMFDAIPLIAFGTDEFKRPVIFFNHAEHLFSVGVSIADRFIDFDSNSAQRSKKNRGVSDPFLLPIPVESSDISVEGVSDFLRTLHLPSGTKVVATAGHPHKYIPYKKWSFSPLARGILRKRDRVLIGIGPSNDHPHWREISRAFEGRVFGTGLVSHNVFKTYLLSSDIVVDSFPLSGGTAMIDAVILGKPVLSLRCPDGQMDFIRNSPAYCNSKAELFEKIDRLLSNVSECQRHVDAVAESLASTNSLAIWKARIAELYSDLSGHEHVLRNFKAIPNAQPTEFEIYWGRSNLRGGWAVPGLGLVSGLLRQVFPRLHRHLAALWVRFPALWR